MRSRNVIDNEYPHLQLLYYRMHSKPFGHHHYRQPYIIHEWEASRQKQVKQTTARQNQFKQVASRYEPFKEIAARHAPFKWIPLKIWTTQVRSLKVGNLDLPLWRLNVSLGVNAVITWPLYSMAGSKKS